MTRPPVSAVLVNYNGKDYLESCVASLLREELEEILLVDSGSDDGAAQEIAARAQDAGWPLRLVDLGANLGPSAARNRGLREAQHDLVLLIDNDVELSEGSLERLCAALAEDERRALVQARSVLFDEPNIVHYDGGRSITWAGRRCATGIALSPNAPQTQEPRTVERCSSTLRSPSAVLRDASLCSTSGATTRRCSSSSRTWRSPLRCDWRATRSR
jgi:GT2 family glycosyltransferase